jgi:hypothetical protein
MRVRAAPLSPRHSSQSQRPRAGDSLSRNAKVGDFDDHILQVDLKERAKAAFVDVVEALRQERAVPGWIGLEAVPDGIRGLNSCHSANNP